MARVSLISLVVLIVVVAVLGFRQYSANAPMTANDFVAVQPTETVFPSPQTVDWPGHISRIFVSGEGLEIVSSVSPGGVFQAYMPAGYTSPVLEGDVRIQGLWQGYTCAYGGWHGHCVPEVSIQSLQ